MATIEQRDSKRYLVRAYIRKNFVTKCWVEEIIEIIILFFVEKGGMLYVFGKGQNGCLGIEKYADKTCMAPTLCTAFKEHNALKVSTFHHTLALDIDGNVWSWGRGNEGQLGHGEKIYLNIPTKIKLDYHVTSICAGCYHSLILLKNCWVISFGSNSLGQLGYEAGNSLVPKTIEKLKKYKVIQISAGCDYSSALTADGDLFCFGYNQDGQCGVGQENGRYIKTPTKVNLDHEIEFVDCGYNHALVITRKGLICSFGYGGDGRLGHGNEEYKYVPILIDALKEKSMRRCAAGRFHSLCIDEEGIIWSFGNNWYGQCALPEDFEKQMTPKLIPWFMKNNIKAKECAAGGDASSIIATDGCLYVFGRNNESQLGLNEDKNYYTPTQLSIPQNMQIKGISMGYQHSAIICTP